MRKSENQVYIIFLNIKNPKYFWKPNRTGKLKIPKDIYIIPIPTRTEIEKIRIWIEKSDSKKEK